MGDTRNILFPLEEKSNYFILESLSRKRERGLKDRRPEEGRCDKEMNYCEYDRSREGGKATLGYTQLVIIILPALPRSQPPAFYQEGEKQNEILTL